MSKVTIKFSKESHEILIQEGDNLETLQAKVYGLTTVPPKSMKLLLKGKEIKDDEMVRGLKDGSVITLFGTREENTLGKIETSKVTKVQKAVDKKKQYYGLENLGNTCYLNAGVQLLRGVPELREWTKKTKLDNFGFSGAINQLGRIWQKLEMDTVSPKEFVVMFLMMNQHFGPLGKQQDSEEFLQKLIEYFNKMGKYETEEGGTENVASYFFNIEFEERLKNTELIEEEQKVSITQSMKLGCTIGGQIDLKIKTLTEGIKAYLNDTVDKSSPLDGQIHRYSKSSKINQLSPYLMVQMVRFFWKEANELSGTKATNTKITKAVDFGFVLDVYEFCSESLKKNLDKGREYDRNKQQEKKQRNENRLQDFRQKMKDANLQERQLFKLFKVQTEQEQVKDLDDEIYRKHGQGLDTGEYNLVGVITHQGLSADSGHYLAWVHQSGEVWNQYNDDLVTEHKKEDVLNLKGGLANNQMAYVLLYRKREVM